MLPYYLLCTKGYGFSVQDINLSCPADLEPYLKAHKLEVKEKDDMAWAMCGNYVLSALYVAIEGCFAGRKSKAKYIEKPLLSESENEEKELTEEEIQEKRVAFMNKLLSMKDKFDASKK